jgi:hypothetical protein
MIVHFALAAWFFGTTISVSHASLIDDMIHWAYCEGMDDEPVLHSTGNSERLDRLVGCSAALATAAIPSGPRVLVLGDQWSSFFIVPLHLSARSRHFLPTDSAPTARSEAAVAYLRSFADEPDLKL